MAKRTSRTIWVVALLAFLLLVGGILWGAGVLAERPAGRIGPALRARLMGLVSGLWVGQVDPRAFAMPGEEIEYWLYYENNGPAVSGATLVDTLPLGCTFRENSVDATPDRQWSYDPVNRRLEFALGNLADHQGGTVRFRVLVGADTPARTQLVNKAQTWVGNNLTDESISAPTIVQAPQIEATLDGPDPAVLCTNVAYTLTYTNTGNTGAVSMTVALTLPVGFNFLYSSPAYTPTRAAGGVLTWSNLPDLTVDGSQTLMVYARIASKSAIQPGRRVICPATVRTQLPSGPVLEQNVAFTSTMAAGPCPTFLPTVFSFFGGGKDAYEPDEIPEQATIMEVDGPPTVHTFSKPRDEDWMRFYAYPYVTYRVETYDLLGTQPPSGVSPVGWEPRTDTVMSVYEPRIEPLSPYLTGELVCESDNYRDNPVDYRSVCCFQATTRGWYYIRVRQRNPLICGAETGYKVRITRVGGCRRLVE